jgi:hypothetical protein
MKKNSFLSVLLFIAFNLSVIGQNVQYKNVKTITDNELGSQIITSYSNSNEFATKTITSSQSKDVNINWQFTDAAAVGSKIQVSSETGQTFMSWWLNSERVSLYEDSSSPEWENFIDTDWEWPIDLTEDGAWAAIGYDSVAQVFENTSSNIFWETITQGILMGVKLTPNGSKIYIARNYGANSYVEAFTIGQSTPDWSVQFTGSGTAFTGSDDGSKLVFCQYSGVNKMWVIDTENGDIIFDAFYKNQSDPALSYDGNIILNGDYSGNVYVYEYDEPNNTYIQKWSYKVGGGGTSVWVLGMGVSGDGTTLAVGTLIFLNGGLYEGEIYLFNSWSPVPLWIFQGAGDEVCDIDFTYDGSLMAAAGWGPMNHTKPDFFLFRKESAIPIFTLNTLGSFNSVDLSPDGSLCAVTGKAVHAREFGSGGILYNIDSDPDGGIISGMVDLENTSDEKNAKIIVNELENYFSYSESDGSHEMKYIPEGTYTVTASKIGYYPVTIENVVIVDGEITTLDFILEETGIPPYDLFATQGSGLTIELSWDCVDPQNFEGFNIYRKHIQGDFFPEEPIATLSNSVLNYEDEDIIPLRNYYYAVTAIIDEGIETPYSNIAEGWMSDGFVTDEISAYVGTTPTIDGTISPGEWDDAFMLDASDFLGKYDIVTNPVGSVIMYYKTNAALTELYVACINENDTELEDHDEVALYIDDNNDGSYPSPDDLSEGNYWAVHYAAGNEIRYRPIYNTGGVGDVIYLDDPQIEVSDATGFIVYEFMIPMGSVEPWQINPNENNQSGLFLFVLDDPSAFDGYWPCWNSEIFIPLEYGQITFDATDEIPPPPADMAINWITETETSIIIEWTQPDINDFNHFNIYMDDGSGWTLLESTIGRQFIYSTTEEYLEFYVTTVDHAGQESAASEIVVFDITIGTTEIQSLVSTQIYPNPTHGKINISMLIKESGNYTLDILNMHGEKVRTLHSGLIKSGQKIITCQLNEQLQAGIYFLELRGEGTKHISKLILMN